MYRFATVLLSFALAATAQAGVFELESETEEAKCTIESRSAAITCIASRKSDDEIEKARKLKKNARDRKTKLFGPERFLLSGAKVSFEGGRTNEDGSTVDGVSLPVRFDDATNTWKILFGWSGKQVLHDLANLRRYYINEDPLAKSGDHRMVREWLLDAVKFDLSYSYGRTAKSLVQDGRNLDKRSSFRVHAKYELGLDTLWAHIVDDLRDEHPKYKPEP